MVIKKLFFSYSRIDGSAFAQKLAVDLKKEGFDVWIDQEDIRAGVEWDMEIEKALENCDCLLFLESEKSVVSNNVLDEVYYALEQHKKVIPVIVHDSKTPYRLQRLQHVDFSKNYGKGLSHLINELHSDTTKEYLPVTKPVPGKKEKGFFSRKIMLGLTGLILLAVAAFFLFRREKDLPVIPTNEVAMRVNDYAGSWELTGIVPEAKSGRGMLKIEALDSGNVKISSSLQFFYIPSNDTLYLSIFNGFAGCSGCPLQNEMKLETEDVAIASNHFSILKMDIPGEGKAGDTIASRGSNESIRAVSTLHFNGDTAAVIKVQSAVPVTLESGITMKPFVYEFRFSKSGG